MRWKNEITTNCSHCRRGLLKLNEFGVCAACWPALDESTRDAFAGGPTSRVVTYTIPAQPGFVRRVFDALLGSTVGTGSVLLLARLKGWI
jgi:hypothetical protein